MHQTLKSQKGIVVKDGVSHVEIQPLLFGDGQFLLQGPVELLRDVLKGGKGRCGEDLVGDEDAELIVVNPALGRKQGPPELALVDGQNLEARASQHVLVALEAEDGLHPIHVGNLEKDQSQKAILSHLLEFFEADRVGGEVGVRVDQRGSQ